VQDVPVRYLTERKKLLYPMCLLAINIFVEMVEHLSNAICWHAVHA